jgi:predicted Zn-dependent peptidase
MIKNPIFPESELEKERQVILEELATSKDDHYTTFFEFIAKNVYASFYGNPILGTEESINSIQIEDLKKFYDKFYKKESMVVSVVSSLKEEEIKILLEKYLYPVDDKFQRLLEYDAKVAIKDDADLLIEKKELQQSLCYVGYKCPNLRSKDAYAVKILASILGDGMDSRLFHSVREDKNLVYSISADVSADVSYGIFYSLFFTRNPEEAYEAVDLEIKKLLEHGLYEEEVQRTKNKIKSVLYKVDESPTTLSNVNLSYFLQRNKVPKLRLNSSIKKLEKVTIDDLMRVAKKIFSEKRMRITMKQEASAVGEE